MPSFSDPPFACPPDREKRVEIVLDLPTPPSVNRLWRQAKGRFYKSPEYTAWLKAADALVMCRRQYPRERIHGEFTVDVKIAAGTRRDSDNMIKAALDWCQSREIIQNDKDCRAGSWGFVDPSMAPHGCRLTLRGVANA